MNEAAQDPAGFTERGVEWGLGGGDRGLSPVFRAMPPKLLVIEEACLSTKLE